MSTAKRYGLALLSSLLLVAASPGQWSVAPLAWFALVPLLTAIQDLKPGKAARLGFFCGTIYFTCLIYWVVIALGRYGGLPLWLSLPALLFLAAYMALYLALFTALLSRKLPVPAVWLAPFA